MPESLSDVMNALNTQYKGRWFVVGSFAAWIHLLRSPKTPTWSKEDWKLIIPGDIDIAISYDSEVRATATINGKSTSKVDLNYELVESSARCGESITITKLEFVFNDGSNKVHDHVIIDDKLVPGLPLVPVKDLVTRLGQGSVAPEKDKARKKREAGLRAAYNMTGASSASLFSDIGKHLKD